MADDRDTGHDSPTASAAAWDTTDTPKQIGPYKILEQIGEGSFGVVYLAEQQQPVRRRVALKIIKLGMDTREVVARFEVERQALAMMDHPNVATVFDAGTTATGRPFFVMEHVPGEPITDYCDRHRLTMRQRLDLFLQACEALQHAHLKGIIHRDVKPSNVLVAVRDGQPLVKLIDLGVAKAISQQLTERTFFTEYGQLIGTPEYMSPEQAEMNVLDIDTRTDIYALGVMLYELLIGALPFDPVTMRRAGLAGIQRMIREEEPRKPSTRLMALGDSSTTCAERRGTDVGSLSKQLRGDLDWITMKAMEKDRTRRYASTAELAADIRHHLRDEPVSAGRPSPVHRLRKFLKRHRTTTLLVVAAVIVLVAVFRASLIAAVAVASVIVAGLAVSLWLYRVAEAERRLAEQARGDAERQREQAEAAAAAEREQRGRADAARVEANRQAKMAKAVSEFLSRTLLAANPWSDEVVTTAGREVRVVDILDAAAETIATDLADFPEVEAAVRATFGRTYDAVGRLEQAESLLKEALAIRQRVLGDDHVDTLTSLHDLAWHYRHKLCHEEASPLEEQCLEGRRRLLGDEHPDTIKSLLGLADCRAWQSRMDEAEALGLESLELCRRVFGAEDLQTSHAMTTVAGLYHQSGRLDEAEQVYAQALEIQRRTRGEEHAGTLRMMNNLAAVYRDQRRFEVAEPIQRRVVELWRRMLGQDHLDTVIAVGNLGAICTSLKRFDEAEQLLAPALERARQLLPSRTVARLLTKYGQCLIGLARHDDAEAALLESRRILDAAPDVSRSWRLDVIEALIELYEVCDQPEKITEYRALRESI